MFGRYILIFEKIQGHTSGHSKHFLKNLWVLKEAASRFEFLLTRQK